LVDENSLVVVNKIDLLPTQKRQEKDVIFISALTGDGIEGLVEKLTKEITNRFASDTTPPLTRVRHRAALEECIDHLARALVVSQADLRAEDVRLAMRSLGRITGRVDVEDLLDIIFRDFCIGK